VDTSGYMPGLQQERGGILIEGARLLRAYAELDVPTISVTLRKSYGGANVLAGASQLKLALPSAQIAPMGEDAAVMVMLGPPKVDDADDAAAREALRQTWRKTHGDAWLAAERGFFDAIIHPEAMRAELWRALRVLQPQP
jgi:propionyl-CoA carboxylase beta chain